MGTAARKARKRAGQPLVKPAKTPSRPYSSGRPAGLGLITRAEIITSLMVRGAL